MAQLLDLLVAAEGFVPVAGRVYAQDGNGWVFPYGGDPLPIFKRGLWSQGLCRMANDYDLFQVADDHASAIITAEAILEARACL